MTKPRRILHIFASLDIGGAESRTMDIYRKIDKEKFNFDFLTMQTKEQYFENEIRTLGGKIYKISPPRRSGILKNAINIYQVIRKFGPYDVVHAHTSFHMGLVMLVARLAGVQVRVTHARTTNTNSKRWNTMMFVFIGRLLIKIFATHRLAISQKAAEYVYGSTYPARKYIVLQNAIELEKFLNVSNIEISQLRKELRVSNDTTIIGHVGRFEKMKNQGFLLDIFNYYVKKNPDSVLLFVGDGKEIENIKEKAGLYNLTDKVLFLGLRNDVHKLMNLFDILVMPSIYEGLCGVAIESQASGTPCVLSNTIPKEVDFNLGLVSFISLEEKISIWIEEIERKIFEDKIEKSRIMKEFNNRKFTLDSAINQIISIYNDSVS